MNLRFVTGAAALASALGWATPAPAQDLPRWNTDQACARETSDRAFCAAFERETYSTLSGVWPSLLPEVRKACLDQIAAFGQNSYRLLDGCIEDKLTEMRVDYVRRASRADDPDPAKPAEAKPEPQPVASTPAEQPQTPASTDMPERTDAASAPVVPPPEASETLATTPPPISAAPAQPAAETPKPQ